MSDTFKAHLSLHRIDTVVLKFKKIAITWFLPSLSPLESLRHPKKLRFRYLTQDHKAYKDELGIYDRVVLFCDLHLLKESIKCFDLIFLKKNSLLKLRLLKCMQNLYLKGRDKQFSWDHRRTLHFVTMGPQSWRPPGREWLSSRDRWSQKLPSNVQFCCSNAAPYFWRDICWRWFMETDQWNFLGGSSTWTHHFGVVWRALILVVGTFLCVLIFCTIANAWNK